MIEFVHSPGRPIWYGGDGRPFAVANSSFKVGCSGPSAHLLTAEVPISAKMGLSRLRNNEALKDWGGSPPVFLRDCTCLVPAKSRITQASLASSGRRGPNLKTSLNCAVRPSPRRLVRALPAWSPSWRARFNKPSWSYPPPYVKRRAPRPKKTGDR